MIKLRKIIAVAVLVGLAGVLGVRGYNRVMAAGNEMNQGRLFHDLSPGKTVSFVVRGAKDFHLVSYAVLDKGAPQRTTYALDVAFLAPDGQVRAKQTASLSIDGGSGITTLPDGTQLAQSRITRVLAPEGSTIMQISVPDGRVLLRADRLSDSRATQEHVLERSGRPSFWFAGDELQAVLIHRWLALPVPDQMPSVKLPPLPPPVLAAGGEDGMDLPSALHVGPNRGAVWNVVGPGTLSLTFEGEGRFEVAHLGPEGEGHAEVTDGHATLHLPAGPSSVTVRPIDGAFATVRVDAEQLRTLGRTDAVIEPSLRRVSSWLADGERPLRFPMYGKTQVPVPVRLTARALDMAEPRPLKWRFVDAQGTPLLDGELALSGDTDPFAAVERSGSTADLGFPSRTLLMPPAKTAALELSASGTLVEVDALLEAGSQAEPLPPFDVTLPLQLRWQDVPVRGPRWVMLRPLASETERHHLFATILRMPRIEPIAPLPEGPWLALEPETHRRAHITEVTKKLTPTQELQTLPLKARGAKIVVEDEGKNARRIVATCEVDEELGGTITMLIDGRKAASTSVATSTVRVEAGAEPGVHKVKVVGAERGRCTLAARPAKGAITVRRTVYRIPSKKGLDLKVATKGGGPLRVHYALYTDSKEEVKDASFMVTVDGGSPARRVGSYTALTPGQVNQVVRIAGSSLPSYGPQARRSMKGVAVAAVQLGDDVPAGRHRIRLRALTPGRYWARFWIEGKPQRPEVAESFITTEAAEQTEED